MTDAHEAELLRRLREFAEGDALRVTSPHVRAHVLQAWDEQHSPLTASAPRPRYWLRVGLLFATATATMFVAVKTPWRSEWLATVEAADGTHYPLQAHVVLRPQVGTAMLTLKDGSRVEVRSHSELSLDRAADGLGIQLRSGSLIVDAAVPSNGHLYVHTNDLTVAVVSTTVVVNADEQGSRVMVVKGEARVREGAVERKIRSGEQMSTSPVVATRAIRDEIGWSRQRDVILSAFSSGMIQTAGPLAQAGTAAGEPTKLDFETASIRECDPDHLPETPDGGRGGGANSFQLTPGRLRALCMTMATLIRTAFGYGPIDLDFEVGAGRAMQFSSVYGLGVEDGRRVRGGPDWIRSTHYTVEAVAAPGAQPDAETLRRTMLQRLLQRRTALKVHVETEDVPAFALTAAKGGMKLKPVGADACEPRPPYVPGTPVENLPRPRSFSDVRRGEKPSCGMFGQRNGPNMVFVGGGVPLTTLTNLLGFELGGVRVLDRTGTTDKFNIILEFALDENAPGLRGARLAAPQDAQDVAPAGTIFTALQDQLGLKLESASAGREFLIVDHIERPTPN